MAKNASAMQVSVWTTGAGIVIGTNLDIGGIFMGSADTTVTLVVGTATMMSVSGGSLVFLPTGTTGAITGTSSGGSFAVLFRSRPR